MESWRRTSGQKTSRTSSPCMGRQAGGRAPEKECFAILAPTYPTMRSKIPSSRQHTLRHPLQAHQKRTNSLEKPFFLHVFHSPAQVPKSIRNAPRTFPEAAKLSPKWQSCHYHDPSFRLYWLILALLAAILPLLFTTSAPTCPKMRSKMPSSNQHRWRQPKMPQPHFPGTPKVFRSPAQVPKSIKSAPGAALYHLATVQHRVSCVLLPS